MDHVRIMLRLIPVCAMLDGVGPGRFFFFDKIISLNRNVINYHTCQQLAGGGSFKFVCIPVFVFGGCQPHFIPT